MTDSIGKRIDWLEQVLTDQQAALDKAQYELNGLKLEYVRGVEVIHRETAQANADDLVVDAVGEVPPVDLPVAPRRGAWGEAGVHCCIDRECGMVPPRDDTRHCNCVSKNAPPSDKFMFYACDKDIAEKNKPQRVRVTNAALNEAPAWRRKVDEADRDLVPHDNQSALSIVLYYLYRLASPHNTVEPSWCLAKIVAVCEREIEGAADPDGTDWGIDDDPVDVLWLLDALSQYSPPSNWRITGNRAAYRLRDILSKEQT